MSSLLKWWLMVCTTLLGVSIAVYFNIHEQLYYADVTRLSFLIIFIFFCSSIWVGTKTYAVVVKHDYNQQSDVGWFIAEVLLAIGMIGTVTGFLLMLGTAFSNIDITDTATLQNALANMAVGMSTALYTTLIGLICSTIMKVQLMNLEVALRQDDN
jgi:hypothetical protein